MYKFTPDPYSKRKLSQNLVRRELRDSPIQMWLDWASQNWGQGRRAEAEFLQDIHVRDSVRHLSYEGEGQYMGKCEIKWNILWTLLSTKISTGII